MREVAKVVAPLRAVAAQWGAAGAATGVARRHVIAVAHQPVVAAVAAIVAVVVAAAVAVAALPHVLAAAVRDAVVVVSPTVPRHVLAPRCRVVRFVPIRAARTVRLPVRQPARHQVAMARAIAIALGRAVPPVRVVRIAALRDVPLRVATIVVQILAMPSVLGLAT